MNSFYLMQTIPVMFRATFTYIHIYIYIYVCVCIYIYTHTHTYTFIVRPLRLHAVISY